MKILVNGLLPHNSGKTTMALSLIKVFKDLGLDVGFCKPVSGINGWYQFHCIEKSLKLGFLVGEDLIKLHEACDSKNDLRVEGAVVSAVFPPDPEKIDFRIDYYGLHNPSIVRILDEHYYFPSTLNLLSSSVKALVEKMVQTFDAKSHDDFNRLFEKGLDVSRDCLKRIRNDIVIVESYSNVATPVDYVDYDYVLTVMPCKAVLIDGNDFRLAVELSSLNPSILNSERILEAVKPMRTFEIPPKRGYDTAKEIVSFLGL